MSFWKMVTGGVFLGPAGAAVGAAAPSNKKIRHRQTLEVLTEQNRLLEELSHPLRTAGVGIGGLGGACGVCGHVQGGQADTALSCSACGADDPWM